MRYFETFPLINYNGSVSLDITQRTAILDMVFGDRYAFYPYTIKDGMRAEQIAEKYYGDPDLVWLVYFSNGIVDPYHQWPMDQETFESSIKSAYGSLEAARTKIVQYRVNWYEDTRQLSSIQYNSLPWYEKKYWQPQFDINNLPLHYVRKPIDFVAIFQEGDGTVHLSVDADESQYWSAVTAYDIEEEENARKSHIRLLDSRLAPTAESNLKSLLGV
jgi:hypothetical protein